MADIHPETDPVEHSRMTFGEHLDELRGRLIKALLATVVTFIIASIWASDLLRVILAPYQSVMRDLHADPTLKVASVTETFVTYFKVGLVVGLIAAAPIWLYQLWAFVAAGLYHNERRWVYRFAPLSLGLFAIGVVFGYTTLLPVGLSYLLRFADPGMIQTWIQLGEYLSFFTTLTLLVGLAFQFPVVMIGLVKAGFCSPDTFRKKRKITILLIFIVAGIITPPDPITQSLVAVPLCFLFEIGILLCWLSLGKDRPPVRWGLWAKRGRIALVVLLVLFLLRGRLERFWTGVRADNRVEAAASSNLPWREVGDSIAGARPDGAMQIGDSVSAPLMAVVVRDSVLLLRFRPSSDKAMVVPARGGGFTALVVQTGATVWTVDQATDVPSSTVVPSVLDALTTGGADASALARRILNALLSVTLPDDSDEAAKVVTDWLKTHADQPATRPMIPSESRGAK